MLHATFKKKLKKIISPLADRSISSSKAADGLTTRNSCELQLRMFKLAIRIETNYWKVVQHWKRCPERWGTSIPWGFQELDKDSWPHLGLGVVLFKVRGSFNTNISTSQRNSFIIFSKAWRFLEATSISYLYLCSSFCLPAVTNSNTANLAEATTPTI